MNPPARLDSDPNDAVLANSDILTREEVLKRRAKRLRNLANCYRDIYWSLMEDVRRKHREYYWKFGNSPFKVDDDVPQDGSMIHNHNHNHHLDVNNGMMMSNGNGNGGEHHRDGDDGELGFGGRGGECVVDRCRSKAMPFTKYCHPHILLDSKQVLYKRCSYVFRSTESGAIQCSKPILRSTVPSMCAAHVQKTEKAIKTALRKSGISTNSSAKLASKFQCVISEYVRMIQNSRRAAMAEAKATTKGDNRKTQH